MDWQDLPAFLAVAEELSFTRAATRIGLSGPRLSQRIARLERRLGYSLFERTTRKVELTPAGRRLLDTVRAMTLSLQEARKDLAAYRQRPPTRTAFRLGLHMVGPSRLRPFVQDVRPDLAVRLTPLTQPPEAVVAAVRSRRVQAVFAYLQWEPRRWPDDIEVDLVIQERLHVMLGRDHSLAGSDTVALPDLADETWLGFGEHLAWAKDAFERLCRQHGFTPRYGPTARDDWETRLYIAQGEAIDLMTPLSRPSAGVVVKPLREPLDSRLVLLHARDQLEPQLRHDLVETLRRWYVDGLVKYRSPYLQIARTLQAHPTLREAIHANNNADGSGPVD